MVIEFFLTIFAGIRDWFLDLIGEDDAPGWLTSATATFTDVIEGAAGLGAWFPFTLLGVVGGFLITLWGVLWSVKGLRWVWGLTPFSGGS